MKINILDGKKFEIDIIDQLKEITEYFEKESGETMPE